MKSDGGVDLKIHTFLTLALVGGEWSPSHPGHFISGERDPGTHWIGWVDTNAGLDHMEKRKFLTLLGLELWPLSRPACSQGASIITDINTLAAAQMRFLSTDGETRRE
jgi:hypothetical protein